MTGLVKAKKYDWTDSNMALFGSDTDKQVKKESAQTEPAWQGAGSAPGLKIWRIEKFEIKDWPTSQYGQFFNGDSYIVLNTYKDKESDNLLHDVHFWIGKNSTQDEYGTAAYKTVELDTYLDDVPIQHRECQGHESSLFKSYFPNGITTMEGGAESGFSHVAPEEYEARLFKFVKEQRNVVVRQIPRCPALVVPGDVYILDLGLKIYQYNGEESSPMERSKAMQYVGTIKSERGEATSQVLEGATTSTAHEFWTNLDQSADDDIDDDDDDGIEDKKLLRVNTDTAQSDLVKDGDFKLHDLKSDDVFICDSGETVFVWVGANASGAEKRNGLPYAHNYLRGSGRPWRSITVVREGQRCPQFDSALAA